jgi:D-alanyl-D-alanine carboxypeptidase
LRFKPITISSFNKEKMSVANDFMNQKYGAPTKVYQNTQCIVWEVKKDFNWFVADRIFINKDFKAKLFKAFTALEKAGLHTEIKTYDGCYNERSVRGKSALSLHAWAAAIDLNASLEKLGQQQTNWSEDFVQAMRNAGIFWGGDFINRKDPMHFALVNG